MSSMFNWWPFAFKIKTLTSELRFEPLGKYDGRVRAIKFAAEHHTRRKDPLVASSQTKLQGWMKKMFCEQSACSRHLWMQRWCWLYRWKDGGSAALLKQTSRPTRELAGQGGEYAAYRQGWGLKEFFGWTQGPASDASVFHGRALDQQGCSISSGWRFTPNKLWTLWFLASGSLRLEIFPLSETVTQ